MATTTTNIRSRSYPFRLPRRVFGLASPMPGMSTQTTGVVTYFISGAKGASETVTCTLDGVPRACVREILPRSSSTVLVITFLRLPSAPAVPRRPGPRRSRRKQRQRERLRPCLVGPLAHSTRRSSRRARRRPVLVRAPVPVGRTLGDGVAGFVWHEHAVGHAQHDSSRSWLQRITAVAR